MNAYFMWWGRNDGEIKSKEKKQRRQDTDIRYFIVDEFNVITKMLNEFLAESVHIFGNKKYFFAFCVSVWQWA